MGEVTFSGLNYKKNHYWHEMVRRYFLLLLIPLVFCVVLYFSVQHVVTRQIQANAEATVQQVYASTSSMMREVEIVSDAIFTDIAALNNTLPGQRLPYSLDDPTSICRQLDIRRNGNEYIKHIYLISEEWQRIFSDNGYYHYSSLPSLLSQIGTSLEAFENIEERSWNMQTSSHLTDPYCIVPYRNNKGDIIGRILITLDLTVFVDTISDLHADFVCLYSPDTLITSHLLPTNAADVDWSDESAVSRVLGKQVKCFYVEVGDYTYMAAVERATYYQPFRVIGLCFLIYAAAVFLVGYLYLSKVSRERYRQLSMLIEALPQDSDAAGSYHELLSQIQKALLSARDKDAATQATVSERTLHNLLYGHYGKDAPLKYLEKIGFHDTEASCYVAVFYIRSFDTVALISSDSGDAHDMAEVIFRSSLAQFSAQDFKTISCIDPGSFITVFYEPRSDSDFGGRVTDTCDNVCAFMAESYGIRMQVAVSGAVTAQELVRGFRQAQSLEKFAVAIDRESNMISQDALHRDGGVLMTGDFVQQKQILQSALQMEKYDLIPSMAQAILREHVSPLASNYALAMGRLHAVSNILSEALLSAPPEGIDASACAARLQQIDSISSLSSAVEEIFQPLAGTSPGESRTYKEVERARQYIQDNLPDQNLNVSTICDSIGVISQRLTPMFREQLDMGIAEYVNYCRIEKAKELLAETRLTVKQIGEAVGYSTGDTFTRNFRKLEGLTPTEYRRIVV